MTVSADMLQLLPGVIEPRWWTGSPALPAESFTIDCAGYPMDSGDLDRRGELARRMNALFDEVGLVVLVNTRLTDLPSMREFAKLVIDNEMRYKGGANPRDNLAKSVYEVGAPLGWRTSRTARGCWASCATRRCPTAATPSSRITCAPPTRSSRPASDRS
jgi:hypothetical protein